MQISRPRKYNRNSTLGQANHDQLLSIALLRTAKPEVLRCKTPCRRLPSSSLQAKSCTEKKIIIIKLLIFGHKHIWWHMEDQMNQRIKLLCTTATTCTVYFIKLSKHMIPLVQLGIIYAGIFEMDVYLTTLRLTNQSQGNHIISSVCILYLLPKESPKIHLQLYPDQID